MAKLRVFFYGLVAFVQHDGGATVVLLDKKPKDHNDHDGHGHHDVHDPYVAFDATHTGDAPDIIVETCEDREIEDSLKGLQERGRRAGRSEVRLPGWKGLDLVQIEVVYTSVSEPNDPGPEPGDDLPNDYNEGRHCKWVPRMRKVAPGHSSVDWCLINTGTSEDKKKRLSARMSLKPDQFARLRTCRLVEHEYCHYERNSVHLFEFKTDAGDETHQQGLAEVVVLEDTSAEEGIVLRLTRIGTGRPIGEVYLLTKDGKETIDVLIANLATSKVHKCKGREKGHHFKMYYDVLIEKPHRETFPHIEKSKEKPAKIVQPECDLLVLCSREGKSAESAGAPVEFFQGVLSINSRPVCPMVIVEE
jgi:hypothetical protein